MQRKVEFGEEFLEKVLVMNVSPLASMRHVTIINTDSHERYIMFELRWALFFLRNRQGLRSCGDNELYYLI